MQGTCLRRNQGSCDFRARVVRRALRGYVRGLAYRARLRCSQLPFTRAVRAAARYTVQATREIYLNYQNVGCFTCTLSSRRT